MKIEKKIKSVTSKTVGDSIRWLVTTMDNEFYSTFNVDVGKKIEELNFQQGDTAEIEFITNKKGFKNVTAIDKVIQVGEPEPKIERSQINTTAKDDLIEIEAARHDAAEITKGLLMCGFFNPKEQDVEDVLARFHLIFDEIMRTGRK